MIKKIAMSIAITFLPIVTAQAGISVSLYKQLASAARYGDKPAKQIIDISFSLMMDTALYTSVSDRIYTHTGIDGRGAFCFPHNKRLTGEQLRSYTDAYLEENQSRLDADTPLAEVAVLSLTKRYPC